MKSATGYCPPRAAGRRSKRAGRAVRAAGREEATQTDVGESAAVKPLSLRLNFSWIAAASAVEMVAQWGLVVVLVHLGSLGMTGMLVLAFAVCAPVNALASLGLRSAVVTDARHEYQFGDYLSLRLVTAALALLIIFAIVLMAGWDMDTALIVLVVAVGELLRSVSDIFHALLQQHERMDRIAISVMIRGLLTLALLAAGVYLTGELLWGILGFPLAVAVTFFGCDLPSAARIIRASSPGLHGLPHDSTRRGSGLRPRWVTSTVLRLARLTLPLGMVLALVALAASIPRYMVSHYLGKHALGIFVSIAYLAMVGTRVSIAVGQSAGPRLAKYHAAGNVAAYGRLLGQVLALVAAMGVTVVGGVWLLGKPLLSLLYNANLAQYVDLAVILMLAGAATYLSIPLGIAMEAMRRFKTHMFIRAAGVVVLLSLSPGLIKAYGLPGAAAAMLIGSACTALGSACAVFWLTRHGFRQREATEQEINAVAMPAD